MRLLLLASLLFFTHIANSATLTAHSRNVGVKLSSASIGDEDYTVAGASFSYFVADNLSLGTAYEYWFSGSPSVSKITLDSTYFIPASEKIRPYLGLLYNHYFVGDNSDIDSYGYRAGVAYIQEPMLLSAGIRQEKYMSDRSIFSNDDTTAEFVVGFSF